MNDVPPLVETMRQAINRQDFAGFIACFAEDGEVNDWNRRFRGAARIREWSDTELIGARGTLTITRVIGNRDGVVTFDADWVSSYYTGPGRFTITIVNGKISEMRISEAG